MKEIPVIRGGIVEAYAQARIMAGGKNLHLGSFDTAEEARDAYNAKVKLLHGDFAVNS